jgi:hypothetical protein
MHRLQMSLRVLPWSIINILLLLFLFVVIWDDDDDESDGAMCDVKVMKFQGWKKCFCVLVILRLLYVGQTFIGLVGQNPLGGDNDNGHLKQQV